MKTLGAVKTAMLRGLFGLAGVCALSQTAMAGTVQLDYDGAMYGYESIKYSTNGGYSYSGSVLSGGFNMGIDSTTDAALAGKTSLLGWCIELTQTLGYDNVVYQTTALTSGYSSWADKLQAFVNQRYQEVLAGANSIVSSAFQLAVWEIVNETRSSNSLTGGTFREKAASSLDADQLAAVGLAQTWLSQLGTAAATGNYKIVVLTNSNRQDLITVVSTPLPGAALLFASALGLGGVARKRRAQSLAKKAA